ncbi:MAG: hypothetical protein HYR96_01080 [Deltaproteobacteria bacterium]|nr:hypothetical protein [Deltaproteobacteria bacterium]
MEKPKVILIDGSGYIFRAFYAITRLSTSKGFPTNAVLGFINMLLKVMDVEKPEYLAIAFDTPKPTFRKIRYAEYKANREKPPDDLVKQIPLIRRAVRAFGICELIQEGFEADDLLGTVARLAEQGGHKVEIITGDKDLMQLVNPRVTLYDTMKDRRYDEGGVKEKLGVRPDQVVDYLALVGDSSDNIPGVSGVGDKTACELLGNFGSLTTLYERLAEIKSEKRRETLTRERDLAFLSQELATVKCDVEFDFKLDHLRYNGPHKDQLQGLFTELEFVNLLKRFDLIEAQKPEDIHYYLVTEAKALEELVGKINKAGRMSLDTETTSLRTREANLVGISISVKPFEAYYIPVGHYEPGRSDVLVSGQLSADTVRKILAPVLEDPNILKVGQNIKYDLQILWSWGVRVEGIDSDTLVASYLLDPDRPHNLDALSRRYLNHATIKYEDVTGKGKSQISFAEVPLDKARDYSAEDADVTLRLEAKLQEELKGLDRVNHLFHELEVPLVKVLARMEYDGVGVDRGSLESMATNLTDELAG